jgi:hypothetical protein
MADRAATASAWRQLLTPALRQRIEQLLEAQQSQRGWGAERPVLLLERCWLRLKTVPVAQLAVALPPDSSAEAPELSRFRQLRTEGFEGLAAQEQCWREFGREACSEALRRFWRAQEQGNHGWTFERYLELLEHYRRHLEAEGPRPVPLLVLARQGSGAPHDLHWCWPAPQSIGHTFS